MKGITFNEKHSFTDFNLILNSKKIGTPSKKKIKADVPFMNGTYDFSTIGSDGEIIYTQRPLEFKFTLISTSKEKLHVELTKIIAWLQDTSQSQLILDDIKDYYFLAEAEEGVEVIESNNIAEITVKFMAEPFKFGINLEGSDIWDTFNFEEDVVQDTEFDVVESATVNIINVGRLVTPLINVDAPMSLSFNSKTYNLSIGDNKFYDFKLANGANSIAITGTGHIKFLFRKERI